MEDLSKKLMAASLSMFAFLFSVQFIKLFTVEELYYPRVILIIAFLFGLGGWLFQKAAELWGTTSYDFKVYKLKPNQIDLVLKLSKDLLPRTPSKKSFKKVYQANGQMIRVQFRIIDFLGWRFVKPTGFCSVMPMNETAKELLEKEELQGISFTPEHIVKPRTESSCIYIGAIAAKGFRAKHDLILYLKGIIETEFDHGVDCIFTRPTTKKGLKLAKRFGFQPVSPDADDDELERIYKLDKELYAA